MILQDLFLVTIITERILRDEILEELDEIGVSGYTITDVTGEGSRGIRASDWEGRNVKIESVVSKQKGDKIIESVAEKYFENYAVIAYGQPVKVVRGDKYI